MPKIVDHEQRRREIVDALWQVVADQGFGAVSVRSVAAQAGLPASTVAQAFDSRADMLAHAYESMVAEGQSRRGLLSRRTPTVESLADEVLVALPLTRTRVKKQGVWIALVDAAANDPCAANALVEMNAEIAGVVRERIARAVDAGVLRADVDVDAQTLLVHAMIDGFAAQIIGTSAPKRAEIRRALVGHFRNLT